MKRSYHYNRMLAVLSIALGLVTVSCDDVYDGGEKWASNVKNATLLSPEADSITYTPSTDGSKATITWPVVHGADGYLISFTDVTDAENPVPVDTFNAVRVDGCSITVSREEDMKYELSIRTLGNKKYNNQDAEAATVKNYSTFTPAEATIADGTDLAAYFTENPVPDSTGAVCYQLVEGGKYTLSQDFDFLNHKVVIQTASKTNCASITYTGETARFKTGNALTLKYVNIDASASKSPVIELSSTPEESLKGATGKGDYYNIQGALVLNTCNITGVNNNLVYDGNKKYCVETVLITNSVIHLTSSKETNISGNAVIYFKAGYANTLQVKNSTVYNTGDSDAKYFVQYNNAGRADRGGYALNYVIYESNTFYNVAKAGQWGNYSGFAGKATSSFTVTNNIFVDCGNKQVPRRILGGRGQSSYPDGQATLRNNTYMFGDVFESTDGVVASYDTDGSCIETDPGFKDAANGDFTVSGEGQLSKRTGDPRWLPAAE